MASEMMEALMLLCQEKHIDELYLLDRLEQSLAKSYADVLHLDFGARVTIDRATGRVYVYELVPKGEPDEETGELLGNIVKRVANSVQAHPETLGETFEGLDLLDSNFIAGSQKALQKQE